MSVSSKASVNAANRLGLNYREEATRFSPGPCPIIDVHTHLQGDRAVEMYRDVARQYGIELTYSMTDPESVASVRRVLGDSVRFIATPEFGATNIRHAVTDGFIERIHQMRKHGARITKFWAAPRGLDLGEQRGFPNALRIDAPHYIRAMQLTQDLGMAAMVHIGDPDTWFSTKYADAERFGTKAEQYERFETVLGQFSMPFIAAHCGGWPENLDFLDGLLSRHAHLYLDMSATKWMVRELSRHPIQRLHEFFALWKGRLLFGSDIVVSENHLSKQGAADEMSGKAADVDEAFDLYASRYWALRSLFETEYSGESPIVDPDLAMVRRFHASGDVANDVGTTEEDAPRLVGKRLPEDILHSFYRGAAHNLLEPIYEI